MTIVSQIEPKSIEEVLSNEDWILAKEEELYQFTKSDVWMLESPPSDKSVTGTKWVFRNKLDEEGKVVKNKTRLVAQDYNQQYHINSTKLLLQLHI